MRRPAAVHGFVCVDKPSGLGSTDVVRTLRRLAGQSQVGHGGTLDPLATGVLAVALGNATRLLEYALQEDAKRYLATIRLGAATDTDDAEGSVIAEAPVPPLTAASLDTLLERFRGPILQVPPRYAAIRVDGRRLYEHARAGNEVTIPPREVTISELTLRAWSSPELVVEVACSKGTYIRSLARDIGAALGCGAHLTALRRTQAGPFVIAQATPLAALDSPEALQAALLPPTAALALWPTLIVDEAASAKLRMGQQIPATTADARCAALAPDGSLVAILERADDAWQPRKVFRW